MNFIYEIDTIFTYETDKTNKKYCLKIIFVKLNRFFN